VRSEPPRAEIPVLTSLPLEIATSRLTLRPLREDDVEDLWSWVSDPALPRYMSWKAHVDREETRAWLRATAQEVPANTGITWAIVHEGRASGCVALDGIGWQMRALRIDRADLGYWIAPPLRGHGLMTEAVQAVVKFGFETLGLHKIVVQCFAENDASRRVIEKCGFRFVGRQEEDIWRDGTWHAHLRYEMTVNEHADTTATRRFTRGKSGH
jgi:[ribosomal protein S5]-alanine N-acetyltransferase